MTIDNVIKQRYFDWLCEIIAPKESAIYIQNYSMLLQTLNLYEYVPDDIRDENRRADGLSLRRWFADIACLSIADIDYCLDEPCSMLEMMVALANRCEETIMYDSGRGNRTYVWFREMLSSLNLIEMTNDYFNREIVDYRMLIFRTRQYDVNGRGGLFTVMNNDIDMRTLDIWYQMQAYLREYNHRESNVQIDTSFIY